jgi:hypothetical protein
MTSDLCQHPGEATLNAPERASPRDKRNYAMLAVLLGCGLRRSELIRLNMTHLQQRDEPWAVIDLFGRAGCLSSMSPIRLDRARALRIRALGGCSGSPCGKPPQIPSVRVIVGHFFKLRENGQPQRGMPGLKRLAIRPSATVQPGLFRNASRAMQRSDPGLLLS